MKDLFNLVKKNLEITKLYLELYPFLVRYEEIQLKIEKLHRVNVPQKLWDKQQTLCDNFKPLKLYDVTNFLSRVRGERAKYLTCELTADPIDVLKEIKEDIKDYENQDCFKPEYEMYDHEEHLSVINMKKKWDKIKTTEQLFEIISGGAYEYTTFGDFCPFHNTYKFRKTKLINIAVNNNLKPKDDYVLDIDDGLSKILKKPSKEKVEKDIEQLRLDRETVERVIQELIPVCERAKKLDESWENNFFNNKIKHKIMQKMK